MRTVRGILSMAVLCGCLTLATLTISTQAVADPPACPDGETPSEIPGGWICIPVENPGDPGDEDPGDGGGGGGTPVGCFDGDREVPCHDEYGGTWDAAHGCYAFQVQPQPPAGSPLWEGHD